MQFPTARLLPWILMLATAHNYTQATPNFSGKWTETGVVDGRTATTMTVSQNAGSITVDFGRGLSWTFKLDGSESKNATTQGNRRVEQVSTATWDGKTLAIATKGRSSGEGPFTLRQVWALEGATLVVTTAQISETTKATLSQFKQTYSR